MAVPRDRVRMLWALSLKPLWSRTADSYTRRSVILFLAEWRKLKRTTAGMMSEAGESAMSEQVVCAVAEGKTCSVPLPVEPRWMIPPNRKHMPITNKRLERIDPSMEAWTMSICFSLSATMLTCGHG